MAATVSCQLHRAEFRSLTQVPTIYLVLSNFVPPPPYPQGLFSPLVYSNLERGGEAEFKNI